MRQLPGFIPAHKIGGKLSVHAADDAPTYDSNGDQKHKLLAKLISDNVRQDVVSGFE